MAKLALVEKQDNFTYQVAAEQLHPNEASISFLDPLEPDLASDGSILLTNRELARLLTVATETGCRFQRDSMTVDPLAWLYAPRKFFDGQAAVDACRSQSLFRRAILLHGLSLALDADAQLVDELLSEEPDEDLLVVEPVECAAGLALAPIN